MVSGVVPVLYAVVQAIVEYLPSVPDLTGELELPLSIVDGFTRAYLLCNLIPPSVTQNQSAIIASSPWTLLVTSLVSERLFMAAEASRSAKLYNIGHSQRRVLLCESILDP